AAQPPAPRPAATTRLRGPDTPLSAPPRGSSGRCSVPRLGFTWRSARAEHRAHDPLSTDQLHRPLTIGDPASPALETEHDHVAGGEQDSGRRILEGTVDGKDEPGPVRGGL